MLRLVSRDLLKQEGVDARALEYWGFTVVATSSSTPIIAAAA
tara:strand:- start:361 stop:486 length:126 start_codon:yes stop_codon:yes gene_type:complete